MILRENSYKSLVGELKSAETEVNEIKTVCAHALQLKFSREIEVLQFDADCSDCYVIFRTFMINLRPEGE